MASTGAGPRSTQQWPVLASIAEVGSNTAAPGGVANKGQPLLTTRLAHLKVHPDLGVGIEVSFVPGKGFLVEAVESVPGQPELRAGDVIVRAGGCSLALASEDDADEAFVSVLDDGVELEVVRKEEQAASPDKAKSNSTAAWLGDEINSAAAEDVIPAQGCPADIAAGAAAAPVVPASVAEVPPPYPQPPQQTSPSQLLAYPQSAPQQQQQLLQPLAYPQQPQTQQRGSPPVVPPLAPPRSWVGAGSGELDSIGALMAKLTTPNSTTPSSTAPNSAGIVGAYPRLEECITLPPSENGAPHGSQALGALYAALTAPAAAPPVGTTPPPEPQNAASGLPSPPTDPPSPLPLPLALPAAQPEGPQFLQPAGSEEEVATARPTPEQVISGKPQLVSVPPAGEALPTAAPVAYRNPGSFISEVDATMRFPVLSPVPESVVEEEVTRRSWSSNVASGQPQPDAHEARYVDAAGKTGELLESVITAIPTADVSQARVVVEEEVQEMPIPGALMTAGPAQAKEEPGFPEGPPVMPPEGPPISKRFEPISDDSVSTTAGNGSAVEVTPGGDSSNGTSPVGHAGFPVINPGVAVLGNAPVIVSPSSQAGLAGPIWAQTVATQSLVDSTHVRPLSRDRLRAEAAERFQTSNGLLGAAGRAASRAASRASSRGRGSRESSPEHIDTLLATRTAGTRLLRPVALGAAVGGLEPINCKVRELWDWLTEVSLQEYYVPATRWCADMGAVALDEIAENIEDFGETICLKPIERQRVRKWASQVLWQSEDRSAAGMSTVHSVLPGDSYSGAEVLWQSDSATGMATVHSVLPGDSYTAADASQAWAAPSTRAPMALAGQAAAKAGALSASPGGASFASGPPVMPAGGYEDWGMAPERNLERSYPQQRGLPIEPAPAAATAPVYTSRSVRLAMDSSGSTGLDLQWDEEWGILVAGVDPLPGQPGLSAGDYILAIDGCSLRHRRPEDCDSVFSEHLQNGAVLSVISPSRPQDTVQQVGKGQARAHQKPPASPWQLQRDLRPMGGKGARGGGFNANRMWSRFSRGPRW